MSSDTSSDVVILPSDTPEVPKELASNDEARRDIADATETVDRKQSVDEGLSKTGIGRKEVGKEGDIVDLAEWEGKLKQSAQSAWPLVIFGSGKDEGVSIWNPYLVNLIRTQPPFSPDVSFDANSVSINRPYAALFFHLDTLASFVESDDSASDSDRDAFELLRLFYFTITRDHHNIVRSSLGSGNVRFDNLWAAFEPGELLVKEDGFLQPTLYVIGASTFRSGTAGKFSFFEPESASNRRFCVDAWNIEWDKSERTFNRSLITFTINEYEGTRSVTGFPICQVKYYCHGDQPKISNLLQEAEKRGKEWWDLLSGKPLCRQHDGPATEVSRGIFGVSKSAPKRKAHLSERVIVDGDLEDSTLSELGLDSFADIGRVMGEFTSLLDEAVVQQASLSTAYAHFDAHPPEKAFSSLQAQLAPGIVQVLALSSQTPYLAALKNLSEVNWARESFECLVLEQSKKNLLRSLIDQHYFTKIAVGHDFIEGKGKGLAVILHGPPGTGKTLTAESVAEYTRKPLFRVNVGELTMEQNVVPRMQAIFRKATRWDAILLLDEADVVLEERSHEDLKRNGIVSVFLRMLEYYEGILFLTTNRLGTIDSAFQSRIQLGIPYKDWKPKTRRKVWVNFIKRLPESEFQAKEDLEDRVDEMARWDLNGRDIRNVMGLAQSIALTEGGRAGSLRFSHIKQVADGILVFHEAFRQHEHESKEKLAAVSHSKRRHSQQRAWPGHGSNSEKVDSRSNRGSKSMQQDSESGWDDE